MTGGRHPVTRARSTAARSIGEMSKLAIAAWVIRLLGYGLCFVAGFAIVTVGPPFVGAYSWLGTVLAAGSLLALLGTASGRWAPELMGLPPLAGALTQLALITYRDTHILHGWLWVPSVALIGSFGFLMLARWLDLFELPKASARTKHLLPQDDSGGGDA